MTRRMFGWDDERVHYPQDLREAIPVPMMSPSERERFEAETFERLMSAFGIPDELRDRWRQAADRLAARAYQWAFMERYDMPEHIRRAFGCERPEDEQVWPVPSETLYHVLRSAGFDETESYALTWAPLP